MFDVAWRKILDTIAVFCITTAGGQYGQYKRHSTFRKLRLYYSISGQYFLKLE